MQMAAKAPNDEFPQDRYAEALEHLEKALRTPNAVAQYKKACVLEKMQLSMRCMYPYSF